MSLPPVHPALGYFPMALVVLSFLSDAAAKVSPRRSLRYAGFWLIFTSLFASLVAIGAGYWDAKHAAFNEPTRSFVELHLRIGWTMSAVLIVLTIWRWRIRQQARRVVTAPYVVASFLAVALVIFEGWFGSEMVYARGAGVAATGQGTEPTATAQERLARVRDVLQPTGITRGAAGKNQGTERGRGQP